MRVRACACACMDVNVGTAGKWKENVVIRRALLDFLRRWYDIYFA